MKIEIEPTMGTVETDGVHLRIWKGTTAGGTRCLVLVHGLAVADDSEGSAFEREIAEEDGVRIESVTTFEAPAEMPEEKMPEEKMPEGGPQPGGPQGDGAAEDPPMHPAEQMARDIAATFARHMQAETPPPFAVSFQLPGESTHHFITNRSHADAVKLFTGAAEQVQADHN